MTDTPTRTDPAVDGHHGRFGVIAASLVAVAALGLALVGHLTDPATRAPAEAVGGMIPAAPGPALSATAAPSRRAQPTASPSPTVEPTVYTPPPAATGVDRSTDPVAASAQAQQAASDAVLAWLHSDSDEPAGQRRARLVGLLTPGSSLLTEPAPLLEDAAPHSRGDAKIASIQATATSPSATTGEYLVAFQWSIAWWPDKNGKTAVLAGDTTAVVKVSYVGGRWVAASLEWAGGHS